ncbi:Putative cell wall binding repeat-containing protein [Oribacterium sp. KHPX15]|uniref:transglutaminase domain-containing protein n=1 Tax=unclassified Oribacterium TaxID=2629782 RepID=UPI0004E23590|nr:MULTISPECIES: transglutaminase domain-containing protein [unclassified Oribacterium]SDZ81072.1 Putative cell wall binding repeat-containing protein [Oribacterium sp. KHPX15]
MKKNIKLIAASVALCIITGISACPAHAEGTGWQNVNGGWYYISPDTLTNATGWIKDDEKWYYLDPATGLMQTGWTYVDDGWYYLNPNAGGSAAIGGWVQSGSDWYYLGADGKMLTSTTTPDGYYVDDRGVRQEYTGDSAEDLDGVDNDQLKKNTWYQPENTNFSGSYRFAVTDEQKAQEELVVKNFLKKNIKADMNDFEKEMAVARYLQKKCKYDYSAYRGKFENHKLSYCSYNALVNGKAVCQGYAEAFQELCESAGLSTRIVSNSNHAWNLVKLDGQWYHVDITWADDDTKGYKGLDKGYINLTDDQVSNIESHHTWSGSCYDIHGTADIPTADGDMYDVYYTNDYIEEKSWYSGYDATYKSESEYDDYDYDYD